MTCGTAGYSGLMTLQDCNKQTFDMEGTLWKWTNYFSGWQPRWFVLENGILSYYRSQDDVNNGCKGSIKMSVCDVTVHPTDNCRLDLSIPGEAHFYVKAATPHERQQWLVGLGSCKACLANGRPLPLAEELPEEQIKAKRSELRLYCDLLMQQVHSVKTAVNDKGTADVGALNDATSLLRATCDTFINTLEDCMTLTHANNSPTPPSPSRKSPSIRTSTVPFAWNQASPVQRSASVDGQRNFSRTNSVSMDGDIVRGYIPNATAPRSQKTPVSNHKRVRNLSEGSDSKHDASTVPNSNHGNSNHGNSLPEEMENHSPPPLQLKSVPRISFGDITPEELEDKVPTFFTCMPISFMDIKLEDNGAIPTLSFLDACRAILPIFDKLNPTAFAPVKLDVAGNIRKIQQKYSACPDHCRSLQSMVLYEVQHKQHMNSNSATVALLWLKRGVEYIREFLWDFLTGVDDLTLAANSAYSKTLKQFHSFVVRGVFALAVKSVPSKKEFMQHLAANRADVDNPKFELYVMKDIEDYVTAQDVLTKILSDFYINQDLDFQEQV